MKKIDYEEWSPAYYDEKGVLHRFVSPCNDSIIIHEGEKIRLKDDFTIYKVELVFKQYIQIKPTKEKYFPLI